MKKSLTTLLSIISTMGVFAHPGHGTTDGYTVTHYITEPQHAAVLLLIVGAAAWTLYKRHEAESK